MVLRWESAGRAYAGHGGQSPLRLEGEDGSPASDKLVVRGRILGGGGRVYTLTSKMGRFATCELCAHMEQRPIRL